MVPPPPTVPVPSPPHTPPQRSCTPPPGGGRWWTQGDVRPAPCSRPGTWLCPCAGGGVCWLSSPGPGCSMASPQRWSSVHQGLPPHLQRPIGDQRLLSGPYLDGEEGLERGGGNGPSLEWLSRHVTT